MIEWILENKEWLFSGLGLAMLGGIWYLLRTGYSRWRERFDTSGQKQPHPSDYQIEHETVKAKTLIARLPTFVLRLVLKPEKVSSQVLIALRGENPIDLGLHSEVPRIDIYFEITNLSSLDLVLDRMLIKMWFGQPTFSRSVLRRYKVPAFQITRGIHFHHELTSSQKTQIEHFVNANSHKGSIYLYLTAYFESKSGRILVEDRIERRSI